MVVERPHSLGTEEAKRKLNAFVDHLLARAGPGGVVVEGVQKTWTGDRLAISARVRKGVMATTLGGTFDVADDRVVVETELPPMAAAFIGEERIRQGISDRVDAALVQP
jgi:hypothetical protein